MENLFPSLPHKKKKHGFFTLGLYDQVTKGPEEAEAACETCQVQRVVWSQPRRQVAALKGQLASSTGEI